MSTRYEFSKEAIQNFCNEFKVTINMTARQNGRLIDFGKTTLAVDQITDILTQLCPDDSSLLHFVEERSKEFHPVALTLYVLNEDLWRMMSRKPKDPEKMLPMTTIPWFYWEKDAVGRTNPSGVKRLDDPNFPLTTLVKDGVVTINGKGGDFAGLLEGRIVDSRIGLRPMIIPGDIGPKKNVANYESQRIQISINLQKSKTMLYPKPSDELDYGYSEHPKVFYEHGLQIDVDGKEVHLKVGNRRGTTLRGDVTIFLGRNFESAPDSSQIILFHVWLAALLKTPFLQGRV